MECKLWSYVHPPCQTPPHPYRHLATFLQPLNAGAGFASESVNEDEIPQARKAEIYTVCCLQQGPLGHLQTNSYHA